MIVLSGIEHDASSRLLIRVRCDASFFPLLFEQLSFVLNTCMCTMERGFVICRQRITEHLVEIKEAMPPGEEGSLSNSKNPRKRCTTERSGKKKKKNSLLRPCSGIRPVDQPPRGLVLGEPSSRRPRITEDTSCAPLGFWGRVGTWFESMCYCHGDSSWHAFFCFVSF